MMYKFFNASVITWYFTLARKRKYVDWNMECACVTISISQKSYHLFSLFSKLMFDYCYLMVVYPEIGKIIQSLQISRALREKLKMSEGHSDHSVTGVGIYMFTTDGGRLQVLVSWLAPVSWRLLGSLIVTQRCSLARIWLLTPPGPAGFLAAAAGEFLAPACAAWIIIENSD